MIYTHYEIVVNGHLTQGWSETFDGLEIILQPDGSTQISGRLRDQAALYGLLINLRDWGLSLISVNPVLSIENEAALSTTGTKTGKNRLSRQTRRKNEH